MKTKVFEYKVKKELGNSCSIDGLLARCENYPLCKAMVDHDHDRIKTRRGGEVGDEVDRELFKRERDIGLDWEKRWDNRVCIGLVLLANGATSDKVLYEGGETWPPEIPFQECLGMEDTHVTGQRGGVDGVEQGRASGRGYEHSIAKIEMTVIKRPVRERGASEQGRTLV